MHARHAAHRGPRPPVPPGSVRGRAGGDGDSQGVGSDGRGAWKGPPDFRILPFGEDARVAHHQAIGQEGNRRGAGLRQDAFSNRHQDTGRHPPGAVLPHPAALPIQLRRAWPDGELAAALQEPAPGLPPLCGPRQRPSPRPELRGPGGYRREPLQRSGLPGIEFRRGHAASAGRLAPAARGGRPRAQGTRHLHARGVSDSGRADRSHQRATALTSATSTASG